MGDFVGKIIRDSGQQHFVRLLTREIARQQKPFAQFVRYARKLNFYRLKYYIKNERIY